MVWLSFHISLFSSWIPASLGCMICFHGVVVFHNFPLFYWRVEGLSFSTRACFRFSCVLLMTHDV